MMGSSEDTTLAGRYRLAEKLASGGMSEVYRGVDLLQGREVAIKRPYTQVRIDQVFRDRISHEAQIASALDHPNIVRVYDYGTERGRPFLIMELVEGESLASLLERSAPLSIDRTLRLARDLLAALDYAHARGIVHGDVKPENVLVLEDGRAKLADFGIAEAISARGGPGKTVMGTPKYLAPERLRGEPATPASDLYSLGVLLYIAATGRLPDNPAAPGTASPGATAFEPYPNSTVTVRAGLPAWLDALLLKATSSDPRDRYPSASAMLADLEDGASTHEDHTVEIAVPGPGMVAGDARGGTQIMPVSRKAAMLGVLAGVLALVLVGVFMGLLIAGSLGLQGAGAEVPSGQSRSTSQAPASVVPTPRTATSPPASATPVSRSAPGASRTPTPSPSLADRLRQLESDVKNAIGDASDKQTKDLMKKLDEAVQKAEEGKRKEAADKLDELRKSVQDARDKGALSREVADLLLARIRALADQVQ